jgi:hypothetical protein
MYFKLFAKASASFTPSNFTFCLSTNLFSCLKSSTRRSLPELLTDTVSGFTTKGGHVTSLIELFIRSSDIALSTKVECLY